MADIRIKDLTTLESASLTGDVFVIDGTTGTRKLSAFSPTFGGNATVTGTLSSGGNLSVTGTSAQVILGQASSSQLTYLIRGAQAGGAIQIVQDALTVNRWLALGGCDNNGVFGEGLRVGPNIQIPGTTASTTTSSGALVVSGGVGVGGAIVAGGALHTTGNGTSGPYLASSANFDFASGQARFYGRGANTSTRATLGFYSTYSDGTGGITLQTFDTSGNVTFGSSASSGTSLKVISGVGTLAAPKYSTLDFRTYNDSGTGAYIRTGNRQSDTNEWLLEIAARSNADVLTSVATFGASGTTFAGPLTGGNVVKSANSAAANGTEFIALRAEVGADATLGPALVTIGALPSATGASRYGFIASYDSNDWRTLYLGGSPGVAANGGQVRVPANISSTSTSSGALVVSGGVGVAGAIYAGGLLSSSATTSLDGLPTAGIFGGTKRVALGYNTSGDYGFVACADSGTTWKELHLNPLGGLVKVPQSTASNDAYTGAFVVGGGVGAAGAVNAGTFFGLVDGVTAPATGSGYARIYVDSADGDLKVKFGDGTVKTIATDS